MCLVFFCLWIDKYACLGLKVPCLFVRCMLVCVCVCVFRIQVFKWFLIGLRNRTQQWEASLRVRQSWVPNTSPRIYLNPEPKLWQ